MLKEEWIELLLVKFIINLPQDELEPKRLFFHIQEAYWYYVDFIRPLPQESKTYISFKQFTQQIFNECHLLKKDKDSFNELFRMFSDYITEIPVYGAILLNQTLDKCLLVMNFRCTNYSFPKGKVNENEEGIQCAIREVWEEIGFDIQNQISEIDFIELQQGDRFQKFYIVKDIDENTKFKTNTRMEIGRIEWVKINQIERLALLPGERQKYWLVFPFIKPLKQWINYQLKLIKNTHINNKNNQYHLVNYYDQQNLNHDQQNQIELQNNNNEVVQIKTVNIQDLEKQIIAEQMQKQNLKEQSNQFSTKYSFNDFDYKLESIHQFFVKQLQFINKKSENNPFKKIQLYF